MTKQRSPDGAFRLVLVVGAVLTIAIGVWGLVWTGMLETVLGYDIPKRSFGVVRLFGGVMVSVGVGYALAAMQPQRSRGLLVPLFLVPLMMSITTIGAIARDEIQTGKGIAFAVFGLAYCLCFFRYYPRLEGAEQPPGLPAHP